MWAVAFDRKQNTKYSMARKVPSAQVIREKRPCHLYLDLEFVPAANPGADGNALVDTLLSLISDKIR